MYQSNAKARNGRTCWLGRVAGSFLALALSTATLFAQPVNTYSFSTNASGSLDPMVGAVNIGVAANDDAPYAETAIGFPFFYAGTTYTDFSASPDGFIRLQNGVGTAASQFSNSIVSTTNRPKLFPWWDDVALGGSGQGGYVRTSLTGVSPNQIRVVEWFVTIPRNLSGPANSTFQLWMYESGRIDFVYGAAASPSGSASVGITGDAANANDYQSITTSAHTVSTTVANNSNSVWPGVGRVYTFTPPTCLPPTAIVGSPSGTTGAAITFTPSSGAGTYIVEYGAPGFVPGTDGTAGAGTILTGPGSPINITGLTPATTYAVRVRKDCGGGDFSANSPQVLFNTGCTVANVPYTENFSTAVVPAYPPCIVSYHGGSSAGWVTGSGVAQYTNNHMRLVATVADPGDDWFLTRGINMTLGTSYRLTFKYGNNSTVNASDLYVYYGNSPSPAAMTNSLVTNTSILTGTASSISALVDFIPLSSGVYYIGFYTSTSTASTVYVDDISVTLTPTCEVPTGVSATNVLATTADVNFTCISCQGNFVVEYGLPGFTPGTGAAPGVGGTVVTGAFTPVNLTGLLAQTTYNVVVRENCGVNGYSANSAPVAFTTACASYTAPWTENFDGVTTPGIPNCWALSPTTPVGATWRSANGTGNPGTDPDYAVENVTDHTTGSGLFMWWDGSTTSPLQRYMITPLIDITALTSPYFQMWVYSNNTNDAAQNGFLVDVWDGSSYVNFISYAGNFAGWKQIGGVIPSGVPALTTFRIGGDVGNGQGTAGPGSEFYNDLLVDDVAVVEAPTCPAPSLASVSNIGGQTADVSWTCTGCTGSFIVEYGVAPFTPGTDNTPGVGGTVVLSGTSPVTLSGLTANTTYAVYVRQDCGLGDYSDNFGPTNFLTTCDPFNIPWSDSFESNTVDNGPILPCFSGEFITGSPTSGWRQRITPQLTTVPIGANTGTDFMTATWSTNSWLFTPPLNLTAGQSYDFSFWYGQSSPTTGFTLNAAVGTLNNASAMTTVLGTITNVVNTTYQFAKYSFTPATTGIYYFGLQEVETSGAPWYIVTDDWTVDLTPACAQVDLPTISNITGTTADVAWTCATCTGSFIVEYGLPGFTPGTDNNAGVGGTIVTSAGSPASLSGLTGLTEYEVYVRQDCGSGVYGPNSFVTSFVTLCDGPTCDWTFRMTDSFGDGWNGNTMQVRIGTTVVATFGSTFTTGLGPVDVLIPLCDGGNYNLFWPTGGSFVGEVGVQVIDPNGATIYTLSPGGSPQNVQLTAWTNTCPSCIAPNVSVSNVDANSADVAWTCVGCPGTFVLEYGPSGFTPGTGLAPGVGGTVITPATSPTTISALSASTGYSVYVRQDCGVGGFSANSNAASFITAPGCGSAWYDLGGPGTVLQSSGAVGSYPNNIALGSAVTTICPDNVGDIVTVTFTQFNTESSWDALYIYDGPSTASPKIAHPTNGNPATTPNDGPGGWWDSSGSNTAIWPVSTGNPAGTVTSSDASGCLTFSHISDGSVNYQGWTATITCAPPPACPTPTGVALTNVTGTGADVNFTCNSCPGSFIVEYGAPGFTPGIDGNPGVGGTVTAGAASPIAISGLSPNTQYDVYVRQVCVGGAFSPNSVLASLVTGCGGTQCGYTFRMTDSFGDGWNGNTMQIRLGTVVVATIGSTFTTGSGPVDVVVPLCDAAGYNLFWASGGSFATEVGVQIIDPNGTSIFSYGPGLSQQNTQIHTWTTACPACTTPVSLVVNNITGVSADLAWSCSGCTGTAIVEFGPFGFTPGTGLTAGVGGTVITPATSPTTISGLNGATTYQAYVRQDCGVDGFSFNSAAATFTTACPPVVSAPYLQSFEGGTAPNYGPPSCWTLSAANSWRFATGTGTPSSDPDYAVENVTDHTTGSGFFAWWDGSTTTAGRYMQSPLIDISTLTVPWVEFFYYANNGNDGAQCSTTLQGWDGNAWVNLVTASGNAASWRLIGTVIPSGFPTQTQFRLLGAASTTGGSSFYHDQLVDDFSVKEAPSCLPLSSVSVTNALSTSADVNWVCNSCTGTFIVEYGPAATFTTPGTGATPGLNGTVVSGLVAPPYTIMGLSPETAYRVFVRQDCGLGDYSDNAGPAVFTTPFDCSLSPVIACGQVVTTTFAGTGIWNQSSVCGFTTNGQERVFQFNAPVPGNYQFVTSGGTAGYVDWMWKPASGGCSQAGWTCIDDITSTATTVNFVLPAAGLYYILGDPESASSYTKIFSIVCPATNIDCGSADPIACGDLKSGNTLGGTNTLPATACPFNGGPSVGGVNWWFYTATSDQAVTASTCGLSSFNTRISVFQATPDCNSLVCVAQNDDRTGCANGSSEVTFPTTTGNTYYVAVHGTASGSFQLSLTCAPLCAPASSNDVCANATAMGYTLADGTGPINTGDNTCAYVDAPTSCSGNGPVQGVWYTFNTGSYTNFRLYLADDDEDAQYTAASLSYALYDGACTGNGATSQIACQTNGEGFHNLPTLSAGSDYRLMVYNPGGIGLQGTFGIRLENYAANDAGISQVLSPPSTLCGSQFQPIVILKNFGTNTLTSVTITANIDGGSNLFNYTWTGALSFNQTVPVVLPAVTTPFGVHTFNVATNSPNGQLDEIASNDGSSATYDAAGEQLVVALQTDNYGLETTWVVYDAFFTTVAQGGPYPSNTAINETHCLPTTFGNCYSLYFFDSFGDGFCCTYGQGSWVIRDAFGRTILQDNGEFTSQSPEVVPQSPGYFNGQEFCLPLGPSAMPQTECGIFTNNLQSKVYCQPVPGATSYQFEFSDPDKGFRRRIAVSGRNWVKFGEMITTPLTPGVTYFGRVRADQGTPGFFDDSFGSGCEMGVDPAQVPGCTQLIDDTSLPTHSCGVSKLFGAGDKVYALPLVGATQYRFKFENAGEGFVRVITRPNYICLLNWATLPLQTGVTYDVKVEAFVSGQWSGYCGASCNVTIAAPAAQGTANRDLEVQDESTSDMMLWPNPVRDGQVNLMIGDLVDDQQRITVDVLDMFGKRVLSKQFSNSGELFNTVLELDGLASGMYVVNVTVNDRTMTDRITVQ